MTPPERTEHARRDAVIVGVSALLVALPVLALRMVPSADLAHHELVVAALRDFGDPLRFPERAYRLSLGSSNQLFFLVAWPLAYLLPVDVACKVLFAAIVAAVPLGAARAARALGRSPLVGALLAPLAVGFGFRWGLISYLFGFALLLLALPALDRLARAPDRASALRASAWALAISLAHGSGAMLLGTLTAAALVERRRPLRELALVAAPAVAAGAVLALGFLRFQGNVDAETAAPPVVWVPLAARPGLLVWALYGPLAPWASVALPALLALGVALLASRAPRDEGPRLDRRLALAAALCLAQFFAWPTELGGAGLIFHRFALPAAALLALSARARPERVGAWPSLALLLGPLAMLAALAPLLRVVDRGWRDLDRVIPRVAEGSTIAELDLAEPPFVLHVFESAAARVVAARGGVAHNDFTLAPQYPVRRRAEASWFATRERLFTASRFTPAYDLQRFRYVLVRRTRRHPVAALDLLLAPEARPVVHAGLWSLYESVLPLRALDAPEPPMPSPPPSTLARRAAEAGITFPFPELPRR